uniref:ATP synthase epsilon chain, chloroplastic n=1 Tax=Callipsygma wilsonis TaxID=2320807 RepID=A0A386AZZ6_9CHLO|nr:ATP synthase CF1 subunit epsilon [Callipsygma wilsonis]AYC65017.1 ATP synthase CF1 subunit epsilon [Callipsygma wilsonis]
MKSFIQFNIITPERVFLEEITNEILLPTNSGQIGILVGHAPLITALDVGVLCFRFQDRWKSIALMGGFALVLFDNITILVNEAEGANTVDPEEAQETFKIARQNFLEISKTSKDKVSTNFNYKRAKARYTIAQTSIQTSIQRS